MQITKWQFSDTTLQVLIVRDALDAYFLLNLLLTMLAWIPGVLHAIWVVLSQFNYEEGGGYEPLTRPLYNPPV